VPVLRPDGTILKRPGYDEQTGLVYVPAREFPVPEIPTVRLGALGGVVAIMPISDIIQDFPFVDRASRANTFAKFLTAVIRDAINGPVPLGVTKAPRAGSGKGQLDDVASAISTGSEASKQTMPTNEDEFRKALTSILMRGSRIAVFDNIPENVKLESAVLASCLTSTKYARP